MVNEELYNAIAQLDEPKVIELSEKLESSEQSDEDLSPTIKAVQDGMSEVGRLFESGEYFLAELMLAAEICKHVMNAIRPQLKKGHSTTIGKLVLGTAKGDIHDIGKDLVKDMLESVGFEVHDLGVDVPYNLFVEKIQELNPGIVGISGLLTPAIEEVKATIEAIESAGMRQDVKIIIGGSLMTESVRAYVGADAYTANAGEGVEICRNWTEGGNGEGHKASA